MSDDFQIDPPDRADRPKPPGNRHPLLSRILYAAYALAAFAAAIAAVAYDMTDLAIGAAVIGLVLAWKATQKVR